MAWHGGHCEQQVDAFLVSYTVTDKSLNRILHFPSAFPGAFPRTFPGTFAGAVPGTFSSTVSGTVPGTNGDCLWLRY
jgi:hypothetical protein